MSLEENKSELSEIVHELKVQMQKNNTSVSAVNLQNVAVIPQCLFSNIDTRQMTQMTEIVLNDNILMP